MPSGNSAGPDRHHGLMDNRLLPPSLQEVVPPGLLAQFVRDPMLEALKPAEILSDLGRTPRLPGTPLIGADR
jgi:hypothetical protein